jgi:NADH dehydrogenase [ubiquinone] 1 alpha subcomplex assembly factor 1
MNVEIVDQGIYVMARVLVFVGAWLLVFSGVRPLMAQAEPMPAATCAQVIEETYMETDAIERATLVDMTDPTMADFWYIVNDDVMGGVSTSSVVSDMGNAVFSGSVSLDNNGGFASMQAGFRAINLSEFAGVELRLCGDGKRYGFWLRERNERIVHQYEFETEAGVWATIQVPFADLRPKLFGRWLDEPAIDLTRIGSMSFIIDNRQEGEFALEVQHINVYR